MNTWLSVVEDNESKHLYFSFVTNACLVLMEK